MGFCYVPYPYILSALGLWLLEVLNFPPPPSFYRLVSSPSLNFPTMRSFASTFVTLVVSWSLDVAAMKYDDHNHILYPTKSLTFNSYDTIEVSYLSNLTSPILYTWCRVNGSVKCGCFGEID